MFVAILVIGIALFLMVESHRIAQFDRTYERPLPVDPNNYVLEPAHRLLDKLGPRSSDNSLQFVVMPSFGKRWFAVSLVEVNGKGLGEAIVAHPDGGLVSHQLFEIPPPELKRFFDRWDELTDGYSGDGRSYLDGNPLAFERHRGQKITSGVGNSPCHYDALGDWATHRLSLYVPELSDLREPRMEEMLKSDVCSPSIFGL